MCIRDRILLEPTVTQIRERLGKLEQDIRELLIKAGEVGVEEVVMPSLPSRFRGGVPTHVILDCMVRACGVHGPRSIKRVYLCMDQEEDRDYSQDVARWLDLRSRLSRPSTLRALQGLPPHERIPPMTLQVVSISEGRDVIALSDGESHVAGVVDPMPGTPRARMRALMKGDIVRVTSSTTTDPVPRNVEGMGQAKWVAILLHEASKVSAADDILGSPIALTLWGEAGPPLPRGAEGRGRRRG